METLMASLLLAAAATSSVEYDPKIDFSRYKTWSWHTAVTPAGNSVVDKRIRQAIEDGLAARGISRVESGGGLLVGYHASKTTEIALKPVNNAAASGPAGIRYAEKGALVIDFLDAESGDVIWRGQVSGALRHEPSYVPEQVQEAVKGLLEKFPPPSRRPAR